MIYKINEDIFVLFQNYFNDQFNCIIPNKFEVEKYLKQKDFDYQLIYLEHESHKKIAKWILFDKTKLIFSLIS